MDKINVFSESSETISLLVYTQSFIYDRKSFFFFNNANLLKSIKIYYMPLLIKANETPPIETGIYKHIPEKNSICTSVIFSDCSGKAYLSQNTPPVKSLDELDKIAEDVMLRNPFYPLSFNYTVASDIWCKQHPDYINIIPFSEAKDILRLFLISKKEFELVERHFCDESLYYTYRNRVLFNEYHNFWSSTIKSNNNTDINTASALGNRLILLSMCIDNSKIEAYKYQNNTTAIHLKYHISYLLLLITGTFDSLAWIINNLYTLGFEHKKRHQIDLLNKDFRKAIALKSSVLFSFLSESEFMNRVNAIRELRDSIAHRNFIDTISSGEKTNRQNYLWIDQAASDKLQKAGFDKDNYYIIADDLNAIIILKFLDYLQKATTNIVNCILKHISDEIYHNTTTHDSLLKLLYLSSEPYVL